MSNKSHSHDRRRWYTTRMRASQNTRRKRNLVKVKRSFSSVEEMAEAPLREAYSRGRPRWSWSTMSYHAIESFLRSRVGQDWDVVHSELIARLPTRLYNKSDTISWFVSDKVELRSDGLWDRRSQAYIQHPAYTEGSQRNFQRKVLYVDPVSNHLAVVPDWPTHKVTAGMTRADLRAFREGERAKALACKRGKQDRHTVRAAEWTSRPQMAVYPSEA